MQWDYHQSCLSCSSCSRLSTCSICSSWYESVWVLANKRIYSTRKSVLIKRHNKKKQIVISDASEDNSVDGSTTQQGYIARGKTNLGGDFMSAEGTLQMMSTGHQAPVNLAPVNQSLVSQTVVNQSPVNQSLGKISLVSQELVNQSPINQAPVF